MLRAPLREHSGEHQGPRPHARPVSPAHRLPRIVSVWVVGGITPRRRDRWRNPAPAQSPTPAQSPAPAPALPPAAYPHRDSGQRRIAAARHLHQRRCTPLRTHAVGSIDRRPLRQGADPRRNALSQAAGDTAAAAPWHTRLLQKAHQFAHDTHGHRHTDQLDRRIAALHQPVHQQGEAQGQQVGHQLVQDILLQRHRRLTGVHH